MELPEVILLLVVAVVLAAGVSALVVSISVRRVRRERQERRGEGPTGRPTVGV